MKKKKKSAGNEGRCTYGTLRDTGGPPFSACQRAPSVAWRRQSPPFFPSSFGGVLFLTLSRNKEHRTTLCAYTMCMYITVRRLKDPRALLLTRCIAVVPFYRILELPPVLPLGSRTWCLHRTHVASAIYSDSRAEPRVVWRRSLRDARHGKPITVAQLFSLAELFSFAVS